MTWLIDGTFKISPKIFYQVFTVHEFYMGDVVPFVYAIMPGKTKDHYTTVPKAIQSCNVCVCVDPDFIVMDFEMAMINACKSLFPYAQLSGCLFHLVKNVYRCVCENRYKVRYNENENFRASLRALQAISFVPPNDVIPRFLEIRSQVSSSLALKKLYKYFGDTYIGLT